MVCGALSTRRILPVGRGWDGRSGDALALGEVHLVLELRTALPFAVGGDFHLDLEVDVGGGLEVVQEVGDGEVGPRFGDILPADLADEHGEGLAVLRAVGLGEAQALGGLEEEASISGETPEPSLSNQDTKTASSQASEDASAQNTVLVIDDEASARELLRKRLESEGCSVLLAKSGAEGLALAAEHIPALITLDVMMPGMDGWTVLRRLKADSKLKNIPVVMISMVGNKAMSYSLGAVESLQKPVDRGRLSGLVKKYASSGQKTALVVEDDPAARETMVRTLQGDGWEVDEAENGKIALEKTEQHVFELILLDLMMPVMDGFEFLERLRSSDYPSANTPIIIVTAMELNTEDRKRLQTSVSDVVQKSGGDVESVLEEILPLIHQ